MKLIQMMFMKILYEDRNLFDFRDYPQDSKFFDPLNKKVICKMKDESKGKIISEFVGLKSKTYSVVTVDNKEIKKGKGENTLLKTKYFFNKKIMRYKMKTIQIKLHRIGTYAVCKISLSCFKKIHIRWWY